MVVAPVLPQTTSGKFKAKSYAGDLMRVGDLAEAIVRDWLQAHPDVLGLVDLSRLAPFQRTDMDLAIRLQDGTHPIAEVKWDRNLGVSPYILVEVLRLNHQAPPEAAGALGWTLRTEARWILYFAPKLALVYQFKTDMLRRRVQQYTAQARHDTQFCWVSTDAVKSTLNLLLPVQACQGAFRVHDVIAYARRHIPAIDQLRLQFAPESLRW